MGKEDTVLKIKQLEIESQSQLEEAEKAGLGLVADARTKSIDLVEKFEKEKEAFINQELEKTRKATSAEADKVVKKARSNAEKLKKEASSKMTKVVNSMFDRFKKEILG